MAGGFFDADFFFAEEGRFAVAVLRGGMCGKW